MDLSSIDTGLYLNIVFLSIVGMATLVGLARGFKKSLISFIFNLAFYLVFFLTLDFVVSFLWTFELAPLGGWVAMVLPGFPTTVTTLEMATHEAIQLFVSPSVPLDFTNPQLLNLVAGVGQFAIKLVWFILYFTIGFLVFGLVRLIISSIFIKNTKLSRKYGTKNPLLGGLFGFLQGAVAVYITLIMFGGLMSVAESLIVLIPEDGFEPDPIAVEIDRSSLYQLNQPILPLANPLPIPGLDGFGDIDEMVQFLKDFVQAYNENPIVSAIGSITITDPSNEADQMPLNLYLFDEVLSFTFREQPIALRKELNVVAEIAGVALSSEYLKTSNLGDLTGDEIRQVFSILSRSDLISSLIPLAIEVAIDFTDLPIELSTDELYAIPWKAELANLGNIAALIFDIATTARVFEEGFQLDEIPITKTDAISLFDSLADSQLIMYATAVAITPLLEMVGEPVSLILTVPAGLVWADEFRAIGLIVGELLDLGITVSMISAGDFTAILTRLSGFDFTMFLDSSLITNALVNLLSGAFPIPGIDLLSIPANLDIRLELVTILTALTQIVTVASQLDFNNLQISDISLLTDDIINAIFESKILIATLTKQLLTLDLSGLPIVLPDSIFDEDDYLKKSELIALTQSLRMIASKLACDSGDEACQATGFDLTKITALTETDFNTLLGSEIIVASIGKLIIEQGGEMIITPPQTVVSLLIRESLDPVVTNTIQVVRKTEIEKLLTVITKIDLSDIDLANFTFGPELIDKLKDSTDPTKLNTELADALFNSLILHATLSDLLINTIREMTDLIVIPHFSATNQEVRYLDDTIEYIDKDELIALFEAFFALNITDFENIQFDITMITDNIDALLSSAILHATVSKVLFDLVEQTDLIVVPYFDVHNEPIRLTVGVGEQATTYLVRTEIEAAVDALGVFGITDFESIGEDFDFSPIFAEGNLAILLQSAIIHATVSKHLFDLNIDLLAIPYFDVDNNPIRTTVGVVVEEQTTYLNQSELEALIDALDVFGINDLDSITEEFDFSPIFAEGNITILLQSAIIHATVSKQLFDLNIDLLAIPYFDVDNNPIRTTVGVVVEEQTTYLNQSELEALIDALDVFGINDLDSITEDFDFSPIFAEGNITILLQSAIIHATVSKQLFELNVDLLEIPYFDVDNNPIRTTVGVVVEEQTTYLNQSELEALIDALDVFGINDLDSITEDFDFSPIFAEGNITILLQSAIIHATVSKQLFEMDVDLLEIPYFDVNNNSIRTTVGVLVEEQTTYLNQSELEALIDALDVFGINDLDSITEDFDFSPIFAEGNITILLQSAIIHATVSKQLFEMDVDLLEIPYFDVNDNPIRTTVGVIVEEQTTYLNQSELEALIDALDVFGINDLDSITDDFDFSPIFGEGNMAILLESAIIHATISKQLFEMDVDLLVIPYYDIENNSIRTTVGVVVEEQTTYLNQSELEALIDALDVFGINDLDSITDEFDFSPIFGEGNMAILLESAIIHATVSKQLFDLDVDMLVIPYYDIEANLIRISRGQGAESTTYLTKQELVSLIDALDVFGINDLDSITDEFDFSPIFTEGNMTILLESAIIHATVSKQLFDLDVDMLVIPYYDIDNQPIRITRGAGLEETVYITNAELESLIDSLDVFGINDLDSITDEFDFSPIFEAGNMALILESAIMHATVSKQLFDLNVDMLVIPHFDIDADPIRVTRGLALEETTYLTKEELISLIDSLDLFGITDLDSIDDNFDFSPIFEEGNMAKMLQSAIMHATISKQIFDLPDDSITVPHFDELNQPIRLTVGVVLAQQTTYLLKSELIALIDALDLFGIDDIDAIDENLDFGPVFEEGNMAIMLQSKIIHATIAKQILDLGEDGTVEIPVYDSSNQLIQVEVGSVIAQTNTLYLIADELIALVDALDMLELTDFETFNGSIDLSKLSAEGNMAILLTSAILHATISKQLFDLAEDETLQVPYFDETNTSIRIEVGSLLDSTNTTYLIKSEIEALIDALDVLQITDIDSFTGTIDLSLLAQEGATARLLASAIIHATISDQLFGLGEAGTIQVPTFDDSETPIRLTVGDSVNQTDTLYLKKTELTALIDSLNILNITDIDSFTGSVDLSILSEEGKMAAILESAILHATISNQLYDLSEDETILLPYFDSTSNAIRINVGVVLDDTDTAYIVKSELIALVDALDVLNINDLESFTGSIDLSLLSVEGAMTRLLASAVIHATISEQLFDLSEDGTIVVPYYQEDESDLRITVGVALDGTETIYLIKTELEALIDALNVLDVSDVENFSGSVDLSLLSDQTNRDTVLSSSIIQATISKQLIDLKTDGTINVPYFDEDENEIIIQVGLIVDQTDTTYIIKAELDALFSALDVLEITDVENFDGNIDLSLLSDSETADTVLGSAIIHATVSGQIIDLDANNTIILPHFDSTNVALRINVGIVLDGTNTEYILKAELKALFDALDVLGITDVEAFGGSVDLSLLSDSETADTVLSSAIIHATVSKQILDLDANDTITLPHFNSVNTALRIHVGVVLDGTDTQYVLKAELKALFDALDVLGITDVEAFGGSVDLSLLSDSETADTVLSSAIIHATVSKQILDLDANDTITLPHFDSANTTLRINVGVVLEGTDTQYVLKAELKALFDALDVLGITDVEAFGGSVDLSLLSDSETADTVLASAIIHATVSKQILDLDSSNTLTLPHFDSLNTALRIHVGVILDGTDTQYVTKTELKALFDALEVLNITDVEDFGGSVDLSLLSDSETADTVLASAIIHATVSGQIIDLDTSNTLTLPHFDSGNNPLRIQVGVILDGTDTQYVTKTELKALFDALEVLNITDVEDFDGSVDLSLLSDSETADTVLASAIIHATVSEQIIDLDSSNTLTLPYYDSANTALRINVGVVLDGTDTEYVLKVELKALFDALDVLGISDVEAFTGTVNLSLLSDHATANKVLASAIIHSTISSQLLDLANDDTLSIPHFNIDSEALRIEVGVVLDSTNTTYLLKGELIALFDALDVLEINDVESFTGSVDLSLLSNQVKRDTVLASAIIHGTISTQLADLDESNTIRLPFRNALDTVNIVIQTGDSLQSTDFNYVSKDELKELFEALDFLGITDVTAFNGDLDLTLFYTSQNRQILLESAIMHATISKQLLDLGPQALTIPYQDVSAATIRVTTGVNGKDTEFVVASEVEAIFEALERLGIEDIQAFNGDINLSLFYEEAERIILLDSASMHATMSKQILDLSDDALDVPTHDIANTAVRLVVGPLGKTTEFITKAEVHALFEALELLGIQDITTFDGAVDLSDFFDEGNQNTLLSSASMHKTMTNQILDLDSSVLLVPSKDVNTEDIQVTVSTNLFIVKAEIKAIFNALDLLSITSIDGFTGTISLTNLYSDTNQNILLTSASMHATVSKQILDLSPATLLVPSVDVANTAISSVVDTVTFLTKVEIKAIINGLELLGVTDITDFDGTFTFTNLQTEQQQNTLLSSASMHATISRTLFDLDDSVLIVPTHKQDTTTVLRLTQDTTEFVIKGEIKAILNAFISMGYTNLDGFGSGINSEKFFDDTETILLSSSIQATLSNQILTQTGGAVIVPNKDIANKDIRITVGSVEYVDKDELIAMMNALDLLGLTDFDNISITPTLLFAQDTNEILASVSMQTTISKSILDQASDESGSAGSLIVPNYFRETLPFGLTTTTQVEKAELIALLDSLESLGITNFSDAISPTVITSMNDAQLDQLLGSGSMHTTIDYMIQDNDNVSVPAKARVNVYDLTNVTTKAEVKAFIKAANAFGASDFSTVSFSLNAILALDANQRDITLSSMIVRNKVTPDIVTAVNLKNAQIFPTPPYVIDNSDYEDNDPLTFMTKQGILDALVFLES